MRRNGPGGKSLGEWFFDVLKQLIQHPMSRAVCCASFHLYRAKRVECVERVVRLTGSVGRAVSLKVYTAARSSVELRSYSS